MIGIEYYVYELIFYISEEGNIRHLRDVESLRSDKLVKVIARAMTNMYLQYIMAYNTLTQSLYYKSYV